MRAFEIDDKADEVVDVARTRIKVRILAPQLA